MNNNDVIIILNSKKITRSARHINIQYHHIQNLVEKNIIGISYILSKQMTADGFIKALDKEKFIKFRKMIGMADSIAAEWDTGRATGSSIAAEWATGGPTGWFLGFTPENYENIQKQKHSKKRRKKTRKQTR